MTRPIVELLWNQLQKLHTVSPDPNPRLRAACLGVCGIHHPFPDRLPPVAKTKEAVEMRTILPQPVQFLQLVPQTRTGPDLLTGPLEVKTGKETTNRRAQTN